MVSLWVTPAELDDPESPWATLVCEAVSYALFNLSGQKYPGIHSVTESYLRRGTSCFSCDYGEAFVTDNGHLYQPHGHRYYDGAPAGLRTRGKPIISVSSVETANGIMPSADYRIANRSVIYRSNRAGWDFSSGATVTYEYGQYPPALGRLAALKLANEFVLAFEGSESCALPANVTSVTRLGISFTLSNPAALAALRMTGIYEVDLFLSVSNPSGALKRPKVFSPDVPRGEKYL